MNLSTVHNNILYLQGRAVSSLVVNPEIAGCKRRRQIFFVTHEGTRSYLY